MDILADNGFAGNDQNACPYLGVQNLEVLRWALQHAGGWPAGEPGVEINELLCAQRTRKPKTSLLEALPSWGTLWES